MRCAKQGHSLMWTLTPYRESLLSEGITMKDAIGYLRVSTRELAAG
jgi:hypothetical protein